MYVVVQQRPLPCLTFPSISFQLISRTTLGSYHNTLVLIACPGFFRFQNIVAINVFFEIVVLTSLVDEKLVCSVTAMTVAFCLMSVSGVILDVIFDHNST